MPPLLLRHHAMAALIICLAVMLLVEFALLQRKFDVFTGGFLQPYSYTTAAMRSAFVALVTLADSLLLVVVAWPYFLVMRRTRMQPLIASFCFCYWALAVFMITIVVRYGVLTYFNDTLNFMLMKELGGGSLWRSIGFVADEWFYLLAVAIALAAVFLICLRLMRRSARRHGAAITAARGPAAGSGRIMVLVSVLVAIVILWTASRLPHYRYGLNKVVAYELTSSLLDEVTDFDRDGYGLFAYPPDAAMFDAAIHPGALDIPQNGIDEDGLLGDYLPSQARSTDIVLGDATAGAGRNVVLVVLESTRADVLGQTLYGRPVTPNMNAIAATGHSVTLAYSHTGYT
ncbi:MAG TPA: hypothetical protein VE046_11230, partial [Steroidobacteraceae bacterium]|nr:hypothetical protein [Steroidobacteraceae bacterium]